MKRWAAKRRQALILQQVRGESTPAEAARKIDLTVREIEEWRDKAMTAMENALRSRQRDEAGQKEQEIKQLKQKVGELVYGRRQELPLASTRRRCAVTLIGRKMLNESEE